MMLWERWKILHTDFKYAPVGREFPGELNRCGNECDPDIIGRTIFEGSWSGIGDGRDEGSCCDGKDLHIQEPER